MSEYYCQVKPLTKEEQEEIYMKLPKKDLIKMLIECNRIINSMSPIVVPIEQPQYPVWPYPNYPWITCDTSKATT